MDGALSIDRERFLALVVTLGACAPSQAPVPVLAVQAAPEPDAAAPVLAPVVSAAPAASQSAPPVVSCEAENDLGDVDCSGPGPSCEGAQGICEMLAKGGPYRRRAASVAAECLARAGRRACDIRTRKKCYEEGVRASCPEPQYEARCAAKVAECDAAHVKARFTKEDCMRSLSAQQPRDREWALRAMGPSSEGKCELMFTVY